MEFIVCKFGGTSVATKETLHQIAKILELKPTRRCVVVSAPGKAKGVSVKVTDLLIKATAKALSGKDASPEIDNVKNRFRGIYEPLGVKKDIIEAVLDDFDTRISAPKEHPGKFRDLVVAGGENVNARLFAEYLKHIGKEGAVRLAEGRGHDRDPQFRRRSALERNLAQACGTQENLLPAYRGVPGVLRRYARG